MTQNNTRTMRRGNTPQKVVAAYSTAGLTDGGLRVLSLYGSEDGVLNHAKYDQYQGNLPSDTVELVLEGGCHAGFGSYGAQDGDGSPAVTAKEQQQSTADAITDWIGMQ